MKLRSPRYARFPVGMRSLTRYPAVPSVRVSLSSSFASLRNRQLALSGLRSIKTILNRFYLRSPRVESIKLRYNRFALWAKSFRVCCSGRKKIKPFRRKPCEAWISSLRKIPCGNAESDALCFRAQKVVRTITILSFF